MTELGKSPGEVASKLRGNGVARVWSGKGVGGDG